MSKDFMSYPLSPQVQYFQRIFQDWKVTFAQVRIEYVVILVQESWLLNTAIVSLLPDVLHEQTNDIVSTSRLKVGQLKKSVTVQELDQMLHAIMTGEVAIHETTYKFSAEGAVSCYCPWPVQEPHYFSPQLEVRLDRTTLLSQDINLSEINAELRTSHRPFDGLSDLLGHYKLGNGGYLPQEQKITLVLAPPVAVRFHKCSLSANLLLTELRKSVALRRENISIGLRQFPGDCLSRRSQVAQLVSWSPMDSGFELGRLEMSVDSCSAGELMVSACGHTAARYSIEDKASGLNPRLKVYRRYDPSLAQLNDHLFPEERKSRNLEVGIATLLHLLGASSVQMLPTDAPDVIAETPSGRLVIIECTVKMDDPVKLTKLANRRNAFVVDHDGASPTREVLALLVVSRPRSQITVDAAELYRNQIILIAKEEIEAAVSRLGTPPDLDELWVQMSGLFQQQTADVFGLSNV
jgi:hypothetical protein